MCGIIAVIASRSTRTVPALVDLLPEVEPLPARLAEALGRPDDAVSALESVNGALARVDEALRGGAGLRAVIAGGEAADRLHSVVTDVASGARELEELLDARP